MLKPLRRIPTRDLARVALALSIALILWRLRVYLPPHTLPARGDPALPFQGSDLTPQWAPWLRVAIDTLWQQRTLAFWNPFTNAGAPQFEVPEAGVLSLATLLGALLPLEAAVKWAMLAHVVAGMIGTAALSRRFGVSAPFAAVGAFSFGIGTYLLDHFRAGHLSHIQPMCLAPWAMLLVWNAITRERQWWKHAVAAGVIVGFQLLEGGTSVFLYTIVALSLLIVSVVGPSPSQWIRRLVAAGLIAFVCFLATAAPQLLPMTSYLALTGRGEGVSLEQSWAQVREVDHPLPTVAGAIAMCVGLGWLLAKGQRRAALWLASVVAFGIAAANFHSVYAVLWRFFPGFRYQRIPERATVLVGIAAPPLIAAGIEAAWRLLSRWRTVGAVVFMLGCAAFLYDAWSIAPTTPPMSDPRVERDQNHAMRWLVEHSSGSRVHIWESPDRHWGANNITVPLGLEAITSYTPSEHRDYLPGDFDEPGHRTFLKESYSNPARFWGLLNVRYVLSTVPRAEPGLRLVAEVPRCPLEICQPAKSAGPYIYENDEWLPRGWVVRHALVLVGPSRPVFEASLDLMRMPDFDPTRMVILQAPPGQQILPPVEAAFAVDADVPNALEWGSDAAGQALSQLLQQEAEELRAAPFVRRNNNDLEFRSPSDGWLVVSEKLALFPGWSASINGKPSTILRANGVLSAVRVGSGHAVRFTYEPGHFRLGVILLTVMLSAVAVAERRARRRG